MKTDVFGKKILVLMLPKMVTWSVCNTRTETDVLGMTILFFVLPLMVTSKVFEIFCTNKSFWDLMIGSIAALVRSPRVFEIRARKRVSLG